MVRFVVIPGLGISLIMCTHVRTTELILVPLGAALGCLAALTVGAHVARLQVHRGKDKS